MHRILTRFALAATIATLALPLGTIAASADGPTILAIAPTQVLSIQDERFVAGKDTVIRVALSAPVMSDPATQKVVVKLAGAVVATLAPAASGNPAHVLNFACESRPACGDWKAGEYTFEATVGGATLTRTATFKTRQGLSVLAVPLKAFYGPGDIRTVDDAFKKLGDFTRRVYPVAPDAFKWHVGPEIDLSDAKFDTRTNEGQYEIWKALAELQPVECRGTVKPAGVTCYGKIVGFLRDRYGPTASLQGSTYGSPANLVVATDEDAAATVAHEIAHNYGLGDEYASGQFNCNVNPVPATFVGKDFNQQAAGPFSCKVSTSQPYGGPTASGTLVPFADGPYEVGHRGALPDMMTFMGIGTKQAEIWVTRDSWKQLFDQLDPAKASSVTAQQAASPIRYVSVFGEVDLAGAVILEPWHTFTSTTVIPSSTGSTYVVRAVDAAGAVLATSNLAINFHPADAHQGEADDSVHRAPFQTVIAYPTATARYEIMKGTTVVKTITPSRNAPVVNVTAPKTGDSPAGTFKITWTGTDADGDKLTYKVEFSANGKMWEVLKPETTDTQLTEDFATLGGTGSAVSLVRVTATDGFNATVATSTPFTVAAKAPLAEITFPEAFEEFTAGRLVGLEGAGIDFLDEVITANDSLVWTSDIQGTLGNGELLELTNLKVGMHTITLTVTNSLKLTGKASVTLAVHPAGRKVALGDVYALYNLYLGRNPDFATEAGPRVGSDFGQLVDDVRWSEEAEFVLDAGFVPESKSPYTGLTIKR